jgi:hypothetical protein
MRSPSRALIEGAAIDTTLARSFGLVSGTSGDDPPSQNDLRFYRRRKGLRRRVEMRLPESPCDLTLFKQLF